MNNCDYESEIVISGMAGRFPKSANLDEFWQNLVDGTDMVQEGAQFRYNVEEFDVPTRMAILDNLDKFDAEFFSVHAKQAGALDSRIKLLLETTYEAIVDAGINPVEIQGSRTGVFVGGADSTTQGILSRSTSPDKINKYGALGNVSSMFANRLSYVFNLHGPSYSVDTACSSSSIALHQALQAIRAGSCDAAIVASSTTHNDPMSSQCFHQLKMTSNDGKCKAFDASADGYVRAEAAVALYICKRQVARRVYSTLVHSTTNNDGYKEQGITYPSQHLQEKVMRQLYKDTGISPLEVDYIEAHGTGTKVGDPQELAAITNVFCDGRKGPLHIGSVKSNMGHSEHASGLCGIAKVLLAHSFGQLPANLHYNTPNEEIPSLQDGRINVIDKLQPFNARYVAFNSMGFGGSNVHILMKLDPREDTKIWTPATPVILLGSGRTQQAVESYDVVHHTMEISRQKGIKFTFNLSNKEDSFLEGHTVDGKNLFPATGYVWLVWKCFAQQNRCRFENFPVVLENMRFERMTLLNTSKDTELVVNIFTGSGKFEITESDSIVCSGLVRNLDNTTDDEMIDYQICKEVDMTGPCLNKEDFYKEMHLRGYGHSGLFQGIEQAHTGGIWAKVRWHGEWVSFIDAVLQATLLRNETRDLYVPLRIQKLTINPNEIMEHLAPSDSIMDVKSWQDQGTITCVGMEFRDLSFAKLSKKTLELQKATAEQVFLPYWKTPQVLSETAALEFSVEVALDNLAVGKLIFTEILRAPSNMIGQRVINQAMLKFQIIDFCLVNNSNEAVDEEHIATATSRVVTMDDIDKVEQSLLYIDDSKIIPNVIKTLRHDGFILYKGYSGEALSYAELTVISEKTFQEIDSQSYVKNSELALDTVNRELIPNKTLSLRPLPEKPILEINSVKMSKDAIFVVHPIDGTIDTLRELVSQLEVNVYGIECTKEAPLESLEKLAGYYLNKIREIQPRGPYKLCGYSFGANVAFEMALQLESESETVSLLVMLDGSPRWKHWIDNYSSNTEDKLIWVDLILSSYLSQYLPTVSPQIYQELKGRNTEESKINYAADTLSDANPHVGLEAIRDCVCAVKSRALCGMNYNPVVKVKAKTVLLKALDSNVGDLASSDYNLGEICENAVEVFEIPGNHYCFHERFQELGIAEMLNKIIT
ncbi:unnamed protein product [Allacma fusca]|uniref:Fatty acid synthase n=1 Tax=Allacma fusca TaxID=39272 RepID=A0A8J2K934_9HEXA|nr:unnamed protein product [Allacma fusca]